MRLSTLRTALIAMLLVVPTASRLRASGDPPTPPRPPVPPVAPIPAQPPTPPRGKEIVVDGDRVYVWEGDGDSDFVIDAPESEEGRPIVRFHGRGSGGYIGVIPIWMTPELRQHYGAPRETGVLVGKVEADSPAAKAGFQVGDIVTAVDGDRIASTRDLVRDIRGAKPGDTVKVEIVRDRAAKTLSVTIGKRPQEEMRVGELDPMPRFHGKGHGAFVAPMPGFGNFEDRLDLLEKRLQQIEERLPAK